jgi:hypothetical protein
MVRTYPSIQPQDNIPSLLRPLNISSTSQTVPDSDSSCSNNADFDFSGDEMSKGSLFNGQI